MRFKVKKLIIMLISALTAAPLYADVSISISPEQIVVGEPAQFTISSTEGSAPKVGRLPQTPGISWSKDSPSVSSNTTIINLKRESIDSTTYEFTVTTPGEHVLPQMTIDAGKKQYRTKPITITARERSYTTRKNDGSVAEEKLDNLLFQRIVLPENQKEFYVGEEIPMEVKIYISPALRAQLRTWPEVKMDKVIFHDYSDVNPKNRNFTMPSESVEEYDGRSYGIITFKTAFRPLSPGKLSGEISSQIGVVVGDDRSRNNSDPFDSFFSRSFSRVVPRELTTAIEAVTILPLPEPPPESKFIGLTGNWDVTFKRSPEKIKVGDTVTISVNIQGSGSLETLNPPQLEIPGFRAYPPEQDKHYDPRTNRSNAEIRYLLIPTEPGPHDLLLRLAVFLCKQGKYRDFEFKQTVNVEKSDALTSTDEVFVGTQPENSAAVPSASANNPELRSRSGIIYLKKKTSGCIKLPLTDNFFISYIVLAIFGPLVLLVTEFARHRKNRLSADPSRQRRIAAAGRRGNIIKKLKNASEQEINTVIQQEVVPFVNDMMALPPGTAASELTGKVTDPEMAECLKHSGDASYMPGAMNITAAELRRKVIKAMRRFALVILLLGCGHMEAATAAATPAVTNNAEALTAYDLGHFQEAAEYYRKKLDPHTPDPALVFNLGNCLLQQKKYAPALICYERALRLAPGDSDIEENLNFTRSKLLLPPVNAMNHPLELLRTIRDRLRPDQWLLGIGICWSLAFIVVALRRKLRSGTWYALTLTIVIGLVCVTAAISQYHSSYSADQAVVIGKHVQVYNLPSENSGYAELKLQSGQSVRIEEERPDWIRVKTENVEGWVHAKNISAVWGGWDSRCIDKLCR